MVSTRVEFAVQMTCDNCADAVKQSLENQPGIKNFDINLEKGTVVVDSILSSFEVQKKLESSGKKVVIKGFAGTAAVAILDTGSRNVQGVVRFMQINPDVCIIDGTIDGLEPGTHQLSVHECGDISRGCESVGQCFNPESNSRERLYGDIGKVTAGKTGRATFRLEDNIINVSDIIGRSLVISEKFNMNGDVIGVTEACGIIARSSGLFQNPKTICACDGITIWNEKTVPKV